MLNCPNCGAPVTGGTCEYCGSRVEDPAVEAAKQNLRRTICDLEYHQRVQEIMLSSFGLRAPFPTRKEINDEEIS